MRSTFQVTGPQRKTGVTMSFRMSVIGLVAAGLVLLGNGANAGPLPGAPPGRSSRVGGPPTGP